MKSIQRVVLLILMSSVLVWMLGCAAASATDDGATTPQPDAHVYLANGESLANLHEVVGRISVPGSGAATVSLTGAARFHNSETYFCTATGADAIQTLGPQIINVDGSHFEVRHAAAEPATITYRCVGI